MFDQHDSPLFLSANRNKKAMEKYREIKKLGKGAQTSCYLVEHLKVVSHFFIFALKIVGKERIRFEEN